MRQRWFGAPGARLGHFDFCGEWHPTLWGWLAIPIGFLGAGWAIHLILAAVVWSVRA